MATLQERLQIKRVPIDKWSIKEQLCLASAVVRSGDQNWMSVSRALKQFAEPNRPPDWFSQKNCAAQYGSLLEHVETPKRKKRTSSGSESLETPGENILKKLVQERKVELRKKMEEEKREYLKLKEEMSMIKSASDGTIEKMCKDIEEEEKQKEQDAAAQSQLLKLREERKLEMERVFRPMSNKVLNPLAGLKRKASESLELPSVDTSDDIAIQEPSKPALSPLLTSLLKTPSHVPNVTSSILHSAITNQRTSPSASPTIASLLNTTTSVPVSQSLQQLVSTAIAKEPITSIPPLVTISSTPKAPPVRILPIIPNPDIVKVEDIKQELEVIEEEVIIEPKTEELEVEPEKEADTFEEEVIAEKVVPQEKSEDEETVVESIESKEEPKTEPIPEAPVQEPLDIYDFDNNSKTSSEEVKDSIIDPQDTEPDTNDDNTVETNSPEEEPKKEVSSPSTDDKSKDYEPGSVEIVEVVVMEDDDSDKEMNKKVSEIKREIIREKEKEEKSELIYTQKEEPKEPAQKETTVYDEYDFDDLKKSEEKEEKPQIDLDDVEFSRKSTFTPEYTETFFDDMAIEVTKLDKTGKAKRDYSRTRKKEEKDIDILLAVEKAVTASFEENEVMEETGSEKDSQDSDKKSDSSNKTKIKDTVERSNSPWTEEEEVLPKTRRRLSATPATPIDSIPNSPASGTAIFDDDRDYRTWKKSVLLVYSRLAAHKNASLFLKPITDEQAPGYHGLIYRPMDLTTIRRNIENGQIRTTTEFQRDVLLMFNNAVMYNKSDETVYNMALQMQVEGLSQIQILLQAQTQIEMPARRETRTSESGLKRKRGQEELILKNKKRRDE